MNPSAPTVESSLAPWTGALTFQIECRSAPNLRSDYRHEVVLHDDWTLWTPHDLEAERVAKAFGGYTSCVELVDRTVPALRYNLGLVTRQSRPSLRRDKRNNWRTPTTELFDCCNGRTFNSVRTVVEHMRSGTHLAAKVSRPVWQVEAIVNAVASATKPGFDRNADVARLVREYDGVEHLWQSGIHPDDLPTLASFASSVHEPLPTTYFEGVVYSGYRPEWIDDVLQYRADADTAAWLAWQAPPDILTGAREWGLWLGYGLSRRDFAWTIERRLPADSVAAVAKATGWSERTAARAVVGWAKADCHPTPGQFALVASSGMEHLTPGRGMVDAAWEDLRVLGVAIERSELGVMLALAGNRPTAIAAVKHGVRSAAELVEYERRNQL